MLKQMRGQLNAGTNVEANAVASADIGAVGEAEEGTEVEGKGDDARGDGGGGEDGDGGRGTGTGIVCGNNAESWAACVSLYIFSLEMIEEHDFVARRSLDRIIFPS